VQKLMTPLILGGTGRVGRALSAVWPGLTPVIWQSRREGMGAFRWDILKEQAPDSQQKIDGIIVLAGVTSGNAQSLFDNTALAIAACDLADRLGGLKVLLASSQAVYGRSNKIVTELSPCRPTTAYGVAKLEMEQAIMDRPNVTCLRIGNVAGCDGLLLAAEDKRPIILDQFPNGLGPMRSYIGPKTLGNVLRGLLAVPRDLPRVINVAELGQISMADILDAANVPWSWQVAEKSALPALALDCSVLAELVPLSEATPADLVAQARAAGWGQKA
jgi:nucleoside-diphosphate-sugar epimerase